MRAAKVSTSILPSKSKLKVFPSSVATVRSIPRGRGRGGEGAMRERGGGRVEDRARYACVSGQARVRRVTLCELLQGEGEK